MAGTGKRRTDAAGKAQPERARRAQPAEGTRATSPAASARNGRPDRPPESAGRAGRARAADPESGAAPGGDVIDLEFVRSLIAAVDASGIDTVEVSRGDTRIRISKTPRLAHGPVAVSPLPAAPVLPVPAVSAGSGGPVAEAAAGAVAVEPAARPDLFEIKSPMVGTYYRGPAPEAPPYVDVGSHVVKGQTLCILEAMKLMNELESEVDGVVREVLVDNAEPVEFGQVLFRIELKR